MIANGNARVLLPVPLVVVVVFCTHGFATTFESTQHGSELLARILYGGGSALCLLLLAWLLAESVRADHSL